MYEALAVLAAFTLLYGMLAGGIERTWISGPIIFTLFGFVMGPFGVGVFSPEDDAELLKSLAELTLALVLFTDAAGADLGILRATKKLPMRLLCIGLPLTILLGFGIGKVTFGTWTMFEIALVATMLAPTDAALGKAVVTNRHVPNPIRQGLNVESGLNDGICVPIIFLFLALATGSESGDASPRLGFGLRLFVESVGIGLLTGALLTGGAVAIILLSRRRSWLSPIWVRVLAVAIAFACFGAAQSLGGSGFIASFVGGMIFGALLGHTKEAFLEGGEGIGDLFSLLTWVLFGAAVLGQAIEYLSGPILLYAFLSLTVVRMLPVFLSVAGLGLGTESKLFVGWFGPRGLASIVFAVIVSEADLPHRAEISTVVACTVVLSILAHGLTANPWARAYGTRVERTADGGQSVSD